MSLAGMFLAGSATVFGSILGGATYKRRKSANERLEELEAELEEVQEEVSVDTGREWLDRDRLALSSKTLEATAEVDTDFSEYEQVDEILQGEEGLQDLGSGLLQPMISEYVPNDSPVDRYKVTFDGESGSFSYRVASEEFFDGYDDEDEMQLRSVDEVYSETLGKEKHHNLNF